MMLNYKSKTIKKFSNKSQIKTNKQLKFNKATNIKTLKYSFKNRETKQKIKI